MMKNPEQRIAQTRDVYDAIAPQFSGTRSFLWADLKPFAAFVRDGDRVLDIGCGNGRLLQLFKGKDISYTGIDQSAELLNIARKKFPNEEFIVADMRELPFLDGTFDVIFCIAAFHHLPDETTRIHALREMKRVVKPRGNIMMTNWNLFGMWAKKKYGEGAHGDFFIPWKDAKGNMLGERYYHGFTPKEIEDVCEKAGLHIQEQYYAKKGERSDERQGENLVTILKTAP